jgi:hypothetical protein
MNRLIILGNGFDLAHGFKTSYTDFILWYLNDYNSRSFIPTSQDLFKIVKAPVHNVSVKSVYYFQDINAFFRHIERGDIKIRYDTSFIENIIKKSSIKNWVDIEYEYFQTLVRLFNRTFIPINHSPREDYLKLINEVNHAFEILKNKLCEYLMTIDTNKIDDEIKNLMDVFSNSNQGRKNIFLNFNYTTTIKNYTDDKDIINIHGTLNENKNPVIFGYGDEMDIIYEKIENLNENDLLQNFKSFGYFKTKNLQTLNKFIDSNSFEVFILGHSCGISDRVLLNSIFEHLNCKRIKIYYYQRSTNEYDNDFTEKTQEISRHFKLSSRKEMRDKIIPYTDCKPLKKFKL